MGAIADRGRRVATYLRAHSGYPHIRFRYRGDDGVGFDMPTPLSLSWLTCRNSRHAVDVAKAYRDEQGLGAVAYGYNAEDVEDVVVVMPLQVYTTLISTYIETVIMDRERGKE
jgi:hypothetical protein